MNDRQRKEKGINNEKVTKYGEMVPTNFAWLSLEEQKKKAERLANLGRKTKKF